MANLLNLVNAHAPEALNEVPAAHVNHWNALLSDKAHASWLQKEFQTSRKNIHYREQETVEAWVKTRVSAVDKSVDDFLWDTYIKEDALPVPLKSHASPLLVKMQATPKASLSELVDITQRLGFIIIPFEYLSPKSFAEESYEMRQGINEFAQVASRMDVYVVCPPAHYSLEHHMAAKSPNGQIYAGKNEQAFMALRMTIPALRTLQAQIDALRLEQENMRRIQESLKTQFEQLRNDVQIQLNQMQENARQDLREAAERAAPAALTGLAAIMFDLYEPLMFALKRDTSLRDRTAKATLGPCWGPDFEDIIATAVELRVDKARRAEAEKMLSVWGIYGNKSNSAFGNFPGAYGWGEDGFGFRPSSTRAKY